MRYNTIFAYAVSLLATTVTARLSITPPEIASGPSNVLWNSAAFGLDAPKVSPINSTTYDWWYFDVVSNTDRSRNCSTTSGLTALTIVFYSAGPQGFPATSRFIDQGFTSANLFQIRASFVNGTTYGAIVNATQAYFLPLGNGVTSIFDGAEAGTASFSGTLDMSTYILNFDAPAFGLNGSIVFNSVGRSM